MFKFSVDSKIRGYHVYQTVWPNPFIGEELNCLCEPGNSHDPHTVAVMKRISGDSTVVGHIPFEISSICSIFIRRGGSIVSNVTGSRRYSSDLEKGGLEIPCKLSTGTKEEANKARNRLEATLSTAVAINTVSIRDSSDTNSDLASDDQINVQAKTADDQSMDRATDDQAAVVQSVAKLMPVVDFSLDMSNEAGAEHDVSPEKKRIKLIDSECIIMGEELNDTEVNLAQQLLKKQFHNLNRFKSTLLQDKKCALKQKRKSGTGFK